MPTSSSWSEDRGITAVGEIGLVLDGDEPESPAMTTELGPVAPAMEAEGVGDFTFDGLSHLMADDPDDPRLEDLLELQNHYACPERSSPVAASCWRR